jgi:hypothetical protein
MLYNCGLDGSIRKVFDTLIYVALDSWPFAWSVQPSHSGRDVPWHIDQDDLLAPLGQQERPE